MERNREVAALMDEAEGDDDDDMDMDM